MFIEVSGAKLFVLRSGPASGTAIIAIGGWIGSSELWQEPLADLSDSYVTIAYDHRGSGLTICDSMDGITFESLVADALAVLEAYGITRCVLAAESAGAQTALAVAERFPDKVSHLVIVDGMYSPGVAVDTDPFLQGLRAAYPATIERFVQLCIPEPDSEHLKAWGRKIVARAEESAAIALRIVSLTTDLTPALKRIPQPVLVLHGDKDKIVSLEAARALAATLPDAELKILAGCGHVPTLTRPKEVADAMRAFLQRRGA
ncbi:MAG: alpha/beta hydrolase [Acidobacteria bacterium]|nr:alpha/beta hydrolase [Acidobacteriota bacterium]